MKWFPSPHSGILFLLAILAVAVLFAIIVSVPSFGDSFFMLLTERLLFVPHLVVSVPSFGDSFFIMDFLNLVLVYAGFRPLIRGFFFYRKD